MKELITTREQQLRNYAFLMAVFLQITYFICYLLPLVGLDALGTAIQFVFLGIAVVFYCLIIEAEHKKIDAEKILIFSFMMAMAMSTIYHRSGTAIFLMLGTFIISLSVFLRYRLGFYQANLLFGIFALMTCLVIFNTSSGTVMQSIVEGSAEKEFNPNAAAFLCLIMGIGSAWFAYNQKSIVYGIIAAVSVVLLVLLSSRAVVLGGVLTVFFFFIFKIRRISIKPLIVIALLFGLIFGYLYAVVLFELIGHGKIIIFGKDIFSGRQEIWSEVLQSINSMWLLGAGNISEINTHNQMLSILYIYGLPTLAIFVIAFCKICFDYSRYNKSNAIVLAAITSICIIAAFETYFHSVRTSTAVILMVIFLNSYKERENGFNNCTYLQRREIFRQMYPKYNKTKL